MPDEKSAFADALDPAIVEAVDLDPSTVLVDPVGGAGFSSTFRVTAWRRSGTGRETFFVKTRADSAVMFAGEYASLNALADAVPGFCPRAHAHGALRDQPGCHFLVTDFLLFTRGGGSPEIRGPSLAQQLAVLHTTAMPPVRSGAPADRPWGFPVPTCCGATEQDNTWTASWADFFADRRLRHVLKEGIHAHGADTQLAAAVERTAAVVVPYLLGDGHLQRAAARGGGPIVPVLVHGDLWSGNWRYALLHSGAPAGKQQQPRKGDVVFDPSCVYGHSEYELGIMRMFGGFNELWEHSAYPTLVPKDEPADEWEDRLALYELYHHLNHWVLFGNSYRSGAMSIMQKLLNNHG